MTITCPVCLKEREKMNVPTRETEAGKLCEECMDAGLVWAARMARQELWIRPLATEAGQVMIVDDSSKEKKVEG